MLVVGITGSIGSGKTALASLLKEKGAEVLDADVIAAVVLSSDTSVRQEVVNRFGEHVLQENGEIDRKRLAEVVFADPEEVEALDRIVHPRVIEAINERLKRILSQKPDAIAVVDAPLIIEAGMKGMHDLLVVVLARDELRISRAAGMYLTPEDVEMRDRSQMPQTEKMKYADYIIENEGTLEELRRKADELWKVLQKKLGEKRE